MNFYNENNPKAAAWLRQLIADGHIPAGDVDERSIVDVRAEDLRGYVQCHFFCGIAGWSLALKLAGVSPETPLWTGSCPCPPFSCAGKKKSCPQCSARSLLPHPFKTGIFACCECGHEWNADARHLWPEFYRLIKEYRPPVVYGEQVSGPDGEIWLAGVRACLEIENYGVGAGDICSAGVGAPNIRPRLYWVADSNGEQEHAATARGLHADASCRCGEGDDFGVEKSRCQCSRRSIHGPSESPAPGAGWTSDKLRGSSSDEPVGLGDSDLSRSQGRDELRDGAGEWTSGPASVGSGFWDDYHIIGFTDGKTRRIKPGIEPLASRIPGDLDLLRAYGNAINVYVAKAFIEAHQETCRPNATILT